MVFLVAYERACQSGYITYTMTGSNTKYNAAIPHYKCPKSNEERGVWHDALYNLWEACWASYSH